MAQHDHCPAVLSFQTDRVALVIPFRIADHGDPVERMYASVLQEHLPGYVRLWESYIGNDGRSRLPVIAGLTADDEERRRRTNQFSYSAVLSYVAAHQIGARLSSIHMEALDARAQAEVYLQAASDVVSFFAHVGRVQDMMDKVAGVWRDPGIAVPLNEYFQQRSNVLHEADLPRFFIEGALAIIPPEGEQPDATRWRRDSSWTAADPKDAVLAEEYVRTTLLGLRQHLNDAFERLYALHVAPALDRAQGNFVSPPPTAGPQLSSGDLQEGGLL